jgi:ParB-like nuclease domain
MAKITRYQIAQTLADLSGSKTYEELEQAMRRAKSPPPAKAKQLPLKRIEVADAVFQWRLPNEDVAAKENHVGSLVRALQDTREPFDPLLVFPVRDRVYVIDGHHRLAAYRAVEWSRQVPVKLFTGTLENAQLEALKRNVKDKLPMNRDEKAEAAWRLVKTGKHREPQIREATTIGRSNIYIMKTVLRRLQEKKQKNGKPEYSANDFALMSWKRARMLVRDVEPEFSDEDYRQRNAKKMVDSLLRNNIGQGMSKDPAVTALALSMLNNRLPQDLMYQWAKDDPDSLRDLLDTLNTEAEASPF